MTEAAAHTAARWALVSGANSGIGRAIARGLARSGVDIIVHHLGDPLGAQDVVDEILAFGRQAELFELDFDDVSALTSAAETLNTDTRSINILILNAAVETRADWTLLNAAAIDRHVRVNFTASILLAQALVPAMARRGWGRIVALGSILEARPRSETLVYASLKSAQLTAMRAIARTVGTDGVTVNVVSPGSILTERSRAALSDDGVRQSVERKIPMGRIGTAEDCVAPVLMLCSDAGGYITGANIPVDGGWHIGDAMETAE